MRIVVGVLAALTAGALTSALADPPAEAQSAPAAATAPAVAAPAAPAPAAPAGTPVPDQTVIIKAQLDRDTQHFLAEGYRPEMRNGEQIYCKKETALGSRLTPLKRCGTIEQLKLSEQAAKANVFDTQRSQVGTSNH